MIKMWAKISRFYPPWLDVICVICLGFIWLYTAVRYGLMADQIPTHFGFSEHPMHGAANLSFCFYAASDRNDRVDVHVFDKLFFNHQTGRSA
jgi:hypothetical protein